MSLGRHLTRRRTRVSWLRVQRCNAVIACILSAALPVFGSMHLLPRTEYARSTTFGLTLLCVRLWLVLLCLVLDDAVEFKEILSYKPSYDLGNLHGKNDTSGQPCRSPTVFSLVEQRLRVMGSRATAACTNTSGHPTLPHSFPFRRCMCLPPLHRSSKCMFCEQLPFVLCPSGCPPPLLQLGSFRLGVSNNSCGGCYVTTEKDDAWSGKTGKRKREDDAVSARASPICTPSVLAPLEPAVDTCPLPFHTAHSLVLHSQPYNPWRGASCPTQAVNFLANSLQPSCPPLFHRARRCDVLRGNSLAGRGRASLCPPQAPRPSSWPGGNTKVH